jgi:histone-lysine N-methyltransferase SETMAR
VKKHLKGRKISARWVPHLLTDEQKRQRVKVAKKLLQMFPKYDQKKSLQKSSQVIKLLSIIVSNTILATKHNKHPIIAKRSLGEKKVLYAIFFSGEGVAIKGNKSAGEKGQKYHWEVLQRRST